jgi:hypothetical protein
VSVAAAHLIRLATKPKQRLNAADYAKLIVLSQRRATDRDRHVRAVLNPLFFRIALSDIQNYARVLMETFPSCPPFAVSIVACCAARSSRFREGWVSQHSRMRDISTEYLHAAEDRLPLSFLLRFPETTEPVRKAEREWLMRRQAALSATSKNFVVLLIVVLVVWMMTI